MVAPLNAVLTISTNNLGPRMRPAFNERFDAVTSWFRNHGVTHARAVFAGGSVSVSAEPLDLAIPADQLVVPNLGPGNLLGHGLTLSWANPALIGPDPTLVVVLSTLMAADCDTIDGVLDRGSSQSPRTFYLFAVGEDSAGRSGAATANHWAACHPHVTVVRPAEGVQDIGSKLDHLYSLAVPGQ